MKAINLFLSFILYTITNPIIGCHSYPLSGTDIADTNLDLKMSRTADTCADPSLTQVVFQAYTAALSFHALNHHWAFLNVNSVNVANIWTDQHPAFRAWAAQQPFVVPLFQLGTASRDEYIYMVGPDAETPPIASGFNTDVAVLAWVYDTPVCGSVPLMSAVLPSQRDHYYTTDASEIAGLTAVGWSDTGIVAYVLPSSTA